MWRFETKILLNKHGISVLSITIVTKNCYNNREDFREKWYVILTISHHSHNWFFFPIISFDILNSYKKLCLFSFWVSKLICVKDQYCTKLWKFHCSTSKHIPMQGHVWSKSRHLKKYKYFKIVAIIIKVPKNIGTQTF